MVAFPVKGHGSTPFGGNSHRERIVDNLLFGPER